MPQRAFVEIPPEAHAPMLAALRRARYGYGLALHILVVSAAGRTPTDIAAALFCSRSRVYRTVRAYRTGPLGWEHDAQGRLMPPIRTTGLLPTRRRSLVALLKATPRAHGWCRTRWRCATLAVTRPATRGIVVSAETMRRWLHEIGWVWKRAKLVAKDDDPHRVERLARLRYLFAPLKRCEAMVCADAWALHLWPNVGCAWMPSGTQLPIMTPGQHQQPDLAGALELTTGTLHHCLGPRQTNALCRDLLACLDAHYPAERSTRLYVIADHDKIHPAKAVEPWLATHPRVTRLFWPTYGPQANPLARAFGEVPDCCTRHHRRNRLPDLVADVEDHVPLNGPWEDTRSDLSDAPAVTVAVENIAAEERAKVAACVYQSRVD
ncbi:MAG: IS630 family transposase [Candidatus Entotheonellia bacterium]